MVPNHIRGRQRVVPIQSQEVVGIGQDLDGVFCPREVAVLKPEGTLIKTQPAR